MALRWDTSVLIQVGKYNYCGMAGHRPAFLLLRINDAFAITPTIRALQLECMDVVARSPEVHAVQQSRSPWRP